MDVQAVVVSKKKRKRPSTTRTRWTLAKVMQSSVDLDLSQTIDFSMVRQEHITHGNRSRIPLRCRRIGCLQEWVSSINTVFQHRRGCQSVVCSGKGAWCVTKVHREARLSTLDQILNFSHVRPEHITRGNLSRIPVACLRTGCGHVWFSTITNVFHHRRGCPSPICSGNNLWCMQKLHDEILRTKVDRHIDFSQVREHHIRSGNLSRIPLMCRKPKCGHMWSTTINSVFHGRSGCPRCRSSKGVLKICQWLQQTTVGLSAAPSSECHNPERQSSRNKNIFTCEQTFDDLKLKKSLRIDVWVPPHAGPWNLDSGCCIEYDGYYPHAHFPHLEQRPWKLDTLRRDLAKNKIITQFAHILRIAFTCRDIPAELERFFAAAQRAEQSNRRAIQVSDPGLYNELQKQTCNEIMMDVLV